MRHHKCAKRKKRTAFERWVKKEEEKKLFYEKEKEKKNWKVVMYLPVNECDVVVLKKAWWFGGEKVTES